MNISQALDVIAYAEAVFKTELPEPTVKAWAEMLLDLDYDEAKDAVRDAASGTDWLTIAAVRKAAVARRSALPSPEQAWHQVLSAFTSYQGEIGSNCHPVVAEVARCIGWDTIGMSSTEDSWMQRHFIKLYEARAERVLHETNVLPMLEANKNSDLAALAKAVTKGLPE